MEFQQILHRANWIYMGNNSKVKVKGIGTYKLDMHGDQTLYLHDVFYAPTIR